jgi:hypothetical protein
MKNLLLLSVFAISSFLSSSNLAFSQENNLVEDGLYKAVLQKVTVPDDVRQRPYKNYGEIEIAIKDNRISEFPTLGSSEREVIIRRLIGAKLNFNDEGKATTIKVDVYIKDILAEIVTGKWEYYNIVVKSSEKIK